MRKKINGFANLSFQKKIHFNLYIFFNLIFIFSFFSISKRQVRILTINTSEIHLVVSPSGVQDILNNNFYLEPSNVIVNGDSMPSCKYNCNLPLSKNNVTLVFEDSIYSCENMFKGLTSIDEIDLSNFDFSHVTNMNSMFQECTYLKKITFGNIDTSSVSSMEYLFSKCNALTSIDVSKFDTSLVTTFQGMFERCKALKIIDASNFQTSNALTMFDMFAYCDKLVTVDVSGFDTSKIEVFQGMFYSSCSIKYLDLPNFTSNRAWNLAYFLSGCSPYIFVNLRSFNKNIDIFKEYGISENVKYCNEYLENILPFNESHSNCSDICFSENFKVDISENICVQINSNIKIYVVIYVSKVIL